MKLRSRYKDLILRSALFVVFVVALGISNPGFLSLYTIGPIISGLAVLGLMAFGLAVTMLAGELDLSIASVAAAAAALAVVLQDLGPVAAILISLVGATLFGALQGYLVVRLGINSLMLTLGSFVGMRGVAHLLTDNTTLSLPPEFFPTIDVLSLPIAQVFNPASLIAILVFVVGGVFLAFARRGREIYAIGGGREQSIGAGVPTARPMTIAFAISGFCAGLIGSLSAWTQGAAIPTGFESALLPAATAALIGGIALSGGRGSVMNVVIGVLFVQSLTTYLSAVGAPAFAQNILTGVLLFGVLVLEYFTNQRLRARLRGKRSGPRMQPDEPARGLA